MRRMRWFALAILAARLSSCTTGAGSTSAPDNEPPDDPCPEPAGVYSVVFERNHYAPGTCAAIPSDPQEWTFADAGEGRWLLGTTRFGGSCPGELRGCTWRRP